jgi:hypothetical protein
MTVPVDIIYFRNRLVIWGFQISSLKINCANKSKYGDFLQNIGEIQIYIFVYKMLMLRDLSQLIKFITNVN